jgi:prolyl oligopeptidase
MTGTVRIYGRKLHHKNNWGLIRLCFALFSIALISCNDTHSGESIVDNRAQRIAINYPETFRDTTHIDVYHGRRIADPYHWLEFENSPSVKSWVAGQRLLTDSYLEQLPLRETLRQRLRQLWNHERYHPPVQRGDFYFHLKNDGLQDQDVLYRSRGLYGELDTVFNPNTLDLGQLHDYSFSPDGRWAAVQHSEAGSDWQQILVIDLRKGRLTEDRLRGVKYANLAWYENGFFYSRYPEPEVWELRDLNEFHQLYYHKLGDAQSDDELIFADRINPKRNVFGEVTADERYLVISLLEGPDGNAVYFRDLQQRAEDFTPIYSDFAYNFRLVGSRGRQLYFLTNYGAPNGRIIRVDIRYPQPEYWEEIVPEKPDVLVAARLAADQFLTTYLHNAVSELHLYDLEGKLLREVDFSEKGTILDYEVSPGGREAFFTYTSFTQPQSVYRLDLKDQAIEIFRSPDIAFDSEAYTTKQVWYESYDGEKVPMFIIHRKDITLNGSNPTLLVGDGSLQHRVLPQFNLSGIHLFPAFLERGGICAVANIRGGGEFGKKWYESGSGAQKQVAFDDFQAAAEYLTANKYTSAGQLGIYGRSTGGLLVGVCLTQRPELYAVAIPAVGIMDMLRYHQFTTGWTWSTDYGTSENAEDFRELLRYSPLHNITAGTYPATLVLTGEQDDRVVPSHSYKFVSELQAQQQGSAPILIRIDRRAGHEGVITMEEKIDEGADVLAFLLYNLGTD